MLGLLACFYNSTYSEIKLICPYPAALPSKFNLVSSGGVKLLYPGPGDFWVFSIVPFISSLLWGA
jgi:hypothetical protein